MPSLALPLWLLLAAAAGSEGSSSGQVPSPSTPAAPTVKQPSAPAKPAVASGPKSPGAPAAKPAGKAAPAADEALDEPEEEIVAKPARRPARRQASSERGDPGERKSGWSADRYAAVVPPGLTLAALRSQLSKAQGAPAEAGAPASDTSGGTLAEIERAREALRQETARLEALLKATGNCNGSVGMPIGDGMATAPVIPPAALREAPAEQIDSVSKALKGMKPEQAAPVVARLDRGLAAEILLRMKPADAGAILGLLKPELAAELATQIATRKSSSTKEKKGAAK